MKIAKNISLGIIMQMLVTLMHLIIHFMNSSFEQDIQITCSFIAVILVTYITTLYFDLPIYAIFCGQIITLLFVLIFENEGVYLLYYLHKGSSQWFNPDIFTDAVIIVLEMLFVQLPSFALAKLTRWVYKNVRMQCIKFKMAGEHQRDTKNPKQVSAVVINSAIDVDPNVIEVIVNDSEDKCAEIICKNGCFTYRVKEKLFDDYDGQIYWYWAVMPNTASFFDTKEKAVEEALSVIQPNTQGGSIFDIL